MFGFRFNKTENRNTNICIIVLQFHFPVPSIPSGANKTC